ncbi:aminotransferase class I/II-fold pyridoxal phosphate-dependent enzyme [Maribacter sp. 2307UL18-2]|uniref:aminotransferase class I/II-fold pyridoxal phosphate-dependent enzyme n=1 Tax=Maribacter sp. 2307UL18-2 TaxID=3386274 RepID=UPI0039BCBFA9
MNYSIDSFPGRELHISGKRFLYFGGTSYLGLQTDPNFQNMFIENVKRYGTNYGASRKANIKIPIFDQAEKVLTTLSSSEACTTLSSGFLSGQLVAQHFNTDYYSCWYAPNTHSALLQKESVPFKNLHDLFEQMEQTLANKTPVLFLDAVDTTEACYPNFSGLRDFNLNHVILVVDDSHGIGIMGQQGGGAYQILKKMNPKEIIVCCSLGKGFGIQAGAIFGTQTRIDQLKSTDVYGGASPAAPAALATLIAARPLFKTKLKKLKANLRLFQSRIGDKLHRFQFLEEHPVFSFEDIEFVEFLEENGVLVTNFKYPNEQGVLMSRIVISAVHTQKDILFLSDLVNSYK